jgi:DNA-binding NarL/FixJ family response regulator
MSDRQRTAEASGEASGAARASVVLIHRFPAVRRALQLLLELTFPDVAVRSFPTTQAALAQLDPAAQAAPSSPPAHPLAILLEISPPESASSAAARRLKSAFPESALIMLGQDERARPEALAAGAALYLSQSLSPSDWLGQLQACLLAALTPTVPHPSTAADPSTERNIPCPPMLNN